MAAASAPAAPVLEPPASPVAVASAPPSPTPGADVADLSGRVQRLEGQESRVVDAAAAALAAASLSDAAARPAPFAGELVVAQRLLLNSPDALALAPLAQQGAPTRQALAADLTDLAAQVSTAARAPGKNASFMDRAFYAFSRVVTVRRIDLNATGTDAVLARAERAADDGDLERATAMLDTLPEAARITLAPWRGEAQRRIEIDRHIAGLRAQASADLAGAKDPRHDPVGAGRLPGLPDDRGGDLLQGDLERPRLTWLGWRVTTTAAGRRC